jgi:hypothetical protein
MCEEGVTMAADEQTDESSVSDAGVLSTAEDASVFMTSLDKLQEFKRFIIAIILIGIFGVGIALMCIGVLVMIYKGQYDPSIEAAKWMIALLVTLMASVVGFYFGSNVVAPEKAT